MSKYLRFNVVNVGNKGLGREAYAVDSQSPNTLAILQRETFSSLQPGDLWLSITRYVMVGHNTQCTSLNIAMVDHNRQVKVSPHDGTT